MICAPGWSSKIRINSRDAYPDAPTIATPVMSSRLRFPRPSTHPSPNAERQPVQITTQRPRRPAPLRRRARHTHSRNVQRPGPGTLTACQPPCPGRAERRHNRRRTIASRSESVHSACHCGSASCETITNGPWPVAFRRDLHSSGTVERDSSGWPALAVARMSRVRPLRFQDRPDRGRRSRGPARPARVRVGTPDGKVAGPRLLLARPTPARRASRPEPGRRSSRERPAGRSRSPQAGPRFSIGSKIRTRPRSPGTRRRNEVGSRDRSAVPTGQRGQAAERREGRASDTPRRRSPTTIGMFLSESTVRVPRGSLRSRASTGLCCDQRRIGPRSSGRCRPSAPEIDEGQRQQATAASLAAPLEPAARSPASAASKSAVGSPTPASRSPTARRRDRGPGAPGRRVVPSASPVPSGPADPLRRACASRRERRQSRADSARARRPRPARNTRNEPASPAGRCSQRQLEPTTTTRRRQRPPPITNRPAPAPAAASRPAVEPLARQERQAPERSPGPSAPVLERTRSRAVDKAKPGHVRPKAQESVTSASTSEPAPRPDPAQPPNGRPSARKSGTSPT